jgi:hypothetical protein
LTKAEKIDVRAEVARIAGVSQGNVRKVKLLLSSASPALLTAVRNGDLSIHRASQPGFARRT